MFRKVFVVLVSLACAQARPQWQQAVPLVPGSSGTSNSGITKSDTVLPIGGTSNVVQHQSATGGQASKGGFNVGSASGNTQSQTGLLGTSSSSNTDAQSQQGSVPGFGSLGGGFVMPSIPIIPGFGPSSAQGQSGSNIVQGETIGPHGGSTNIVQQQSGTGGQASNGGFNVGTASGNTQSQTGLMGTSSSSNTNAQSQQGSVPAFGHFGGAGLILPSVPALPGFGSGSAQGQAGSSIVSSDTIGPFGGSSNVVQMQSGTGGQAANGGVNVGSASSNSQNLITPHGTSSSSNTDAQSSQFTNPALAGFGGVPGLPVIPGLGLGSATGNAGSQLTQGKTTGPDGSQTTVTQLGSSAGGSASNGGSSVNQASGSTSSIDGVSGSQTQSNLNSQSVQTGR
ncbi:uncharacterized PE-PGRS family protein PE_PGRS3-like [Amphibalanus amphitrite]|uniref:uncharacterized PE-PGRS family protein PE_PGRS3-like n=1 Tax=Amphibalanus amphitrite TaxID=1232801 RepID=UPI001C902A16|nr:uncharacterized PE-PGRS family protein PE_PGRS3-like [Amphibalanus amphitrite]